MTKQEIQRQQKLELAEQAVQCGILPRVYSKEDFLLGTEPYEYLDSITDPFTRERAMSALCDVASAVGYGNFRKTYENYKRTQRGLIVRSDNVVPLAQLGVPDGPEYNFGGWDCSEAFGITRTGENGQDIMACSHLIFPLRRLVNACTGTEKIELVYKRGNRWRSVTRPKSVLANQSKIIELADEGVGVTSDNAKELVKYLSDIEAYNYEVIPEIRAFDRLGWMDGYRQFSPYLDGAVFDEAEAFRGVYDAVNCPRGSLEDWMTVAKAIRQTSPVPARLALAASLASVIVGPCGANPFFLHLWGGTEAGKTVALMLAASVWADPECGRYWKTFDSTAVGQEKMAGFLGSLPLVIDELMLIRDKKSFDDIVYRLSEGQGRTRGNKEGGVQRQETWRLAIITSGEQPLSSAASGGGAVNRVVDCECTEKLFADPHWAAGAVRDHYGRCGRAWVAWLTADSHLDLVREAYRGFYRVILDRHITTEKQASAAALLLTADSLATENLFRDGRAVTLDEILPYLTSAQEVDQNQRAYAYLMETVAMNAHHFKTDDLAIDKWGWRDEYLGTLYINRTQFGRILADGGYDAKAFLSWAVRQGIVKGTVKPGTDKIIPTKTIKRGGVAARYVEIAMQNDFQGPDEAENSEEFV